MGIVWESVAGAILVFVFRFLPVFRHLFHRGIFRFRVFRQEKRSILAAGRKHHHQDGAATRPAEPDSLAGTAISEGLIHLRLRF